MQKMDRCKGSGNKQTSVRKEGVIVQRRTGVCVDVDGSSGHHRARHLDNKGGLNCGGHPGRDVEEPIIIFRVTEPTLCR